ncbi:hypothetical protein FACS1894192_07400 [Bacilli bacterium]|nr:hypothetical protein FACS1894192_07400 [Bacilli bacterium]
MNNKIIFNSELSIEEVKGRGRYNKSFVVCINGKDNPTIDDFFKTVKVAYQFSDADLWDQVIDWFTDLDWIQQTSYVLIIENWTAFLEKDKIEKDNFIDIFKHNILPWWERDVVNHVVGGEPRNFNVYLFD